MAALPCARTRAHGKGAILGAHCHSLPCAMSRHTAAILCRVPGPAHTAKRQSRLSRGLSLPCATAQGTRQRVRLCRVPRQGTRQRAAVTFIFAVCFTAGTWQKFPFRSVLCHVTLFCRDPDYALGKMFAVCPKSGSRLTRQNVYREPFAVCITAFAVCLRHMAKDLVPVVVGAGAGHLPPTNHFQNMKK